MPINDNDLFVITRPSGTGKGTYSVKSSEVFSVAERTKLSGIDAGAEVNVQSDWNATSGDAQILNKPTIPTYSKVTKPGTIPGLYHSKYIPSLEPIKNAP